ncbi:peptidase [Agrococcus versicolor]|uniref:Peptidase n=1 Tax=Agrococcus versicolor TaxID=501482 RepID=A0ABP5MLP9_9MICO
MRRSIQAITTATIAGAMLALGSGMAVASPAPADPDVDAFSVPASETAAAATAWSPERMQAALPGDELVLDQIDELSTTAAPDGEAVTVAGEQPVLQATRVDPVSHIGKVFFTIGGVDYVCSANSVASANGSTVSTAGHCLNEGPGEFASEFVFVPAYLDGAAPYGQWPAVELVAPTQWTDEGDIDHDTGFAVVASQGGRTLAATVGASGVAFNQSTGLGYTLYGYPAASPFDGQTLQQCAGTASRDRLGGTTSQGVSCDMTGGSSGGPWFVGSGSSGVQNSVNSFGYDAQPGVMYGPYWGSVIQGAYEEAQA